MKSGDGWTLHSVSDLAVGTAAEHMVCADLLLSGHHAFIAGQNCAYDIAVDIDGELIRVHVKSTRRAVMRGTKPATPVYFWHVRRAGGNGSSRVYSDGEFDALALVAIDVGMIAYLPPSRVRQSIQIRNGTGRGLRGTSKTFDQFPFSAVVDEVCR